MEKMELIRTIIDLIYKISILIWMIIYTNLYCKLKRELFEMEILVYRQGNENLNLQKRISVLEENQELNKRGKKNASKINRQINKKNDTVK